MYKCLSELFGLEQREENLFRGQNQALGGGRVFGGQVIGQALAAAGQTVEGRRAHSLHAYFLRVGDLASPVDYAVERFRDGRSFSSRRVVALQGGRPICHLSASFQSAEEGLEYQVSMPPTLGPEGLPELADSGAGRGGHSPEAGRQRSTEEMRIEIRPVPPSREGVGEDGIGRKSWWLRVDDPLPEDSLLHQCVLAYASDFGLLGTARETHGIGFRQPGVLSASLDHSMWFHRDFRCGDWLLHVMDCPNTSQARGFARGQIFSRDGRLLASVAQEGVLRVRPESPER